MTFLPDNYTVPESEGKYFKLKIGSNRFRVLSSAIVGFEGWKEADGKRKPVRKAILNGQRPSFGLDEVDKPEEIKHFWAFPVWSTEAKRVQVFEVTQKSIQRAISALTKNEDWGDPRGYDIVIERIGEGMDTEYIINPVPPKPLPPEAKDAWDKAQSTFDLDRLFDNGDPFGEEAVTGPAKAMRRGMSEADGIAEDVPV